MALDIVELLVPISHYDVHDLIRSTDYSSLNLRRILAEATESLFGNADELVGLADHGQARCHRGAQSPEAHIAIVFACFERDWSITVHCGDGCCLILPRYKCTISWVV